MVLTLNQHKSGLVEDEVLDFGGRITADEIFADNMASRGFNGSKHATVTLDHGTDPLHRRGIWFRCWYPWVGLRTVYGPA